ncbi:MAG: DUF2061 domain-containing protein [Brumimicrobium sp.]|nr:DUF2061 domain-containing protein [Brumimicrobium sp.]
MILDQIINKPKTKVKSKSDAPIRSFVKALSWRVLGTLDTIIISWIISGNFTIAFSIGSFELITKTFLYYFHERLWNNIKWGKADC